MRKLTFFVALLSTTATGNISAQGGYATILSQIESNSSTLKALHQQMEAEQLGHRTGIFLENPEVEFNHLWGRPIRATRQDMNITQSFDFPSAYSHRNRISKLESANLELDYRWERIQLLLKAKAICIELIYYNALGQEYTTRLSNARQIAASYEAKLSAGDANGIENNKAQLNFTSVRNEVNQIEAKRTALLAELAGLNGGEAIDWSEASYPTASLPVQFEQWYAEAETKNPVLEYVRGRVEISQQQIRLNRALALPKFSAGFMSEGIIGEHFKGVSVGISIPLWENKNRVAQARAQVMADQSLLVDQKVQFYNGLQILYNKAIALQQSAAEYRAALNSFNNDRLLKKALDAGEISLLEYLLEMEFYYDAINELLAAEKELELTLAELSAVEL